VLDQNGSWSSRSCFGPLFRSSHFFRIQKTTRAQGSRHVSTLLGFVPFAEIPSHLHRPLPTSSSLYAAALPRFLAFDASKGLIRGSPSPLRGSSPMAFQREGRSPSMPLYSPVYCCPPVSPRTGFLESQLTLYSRPISPSGGRPRPGRPFFVSPVAFARIHHHFEPRPAPLFSPWCPLPFSLERFLFPHSQPDAGLGGFFLCFFFFFFFFFSVLVFCVLGWCWGFFSFFFFFVVWFFVSFSVCVFLVSFACCFFWGFLVFGWRSPDIKSSLCLPCPCTPSGAVSLIDRLTIYEIFPGQFQEIDFLLLHSHIGLTRQTPPHHPHPPHLLLSSVRSIQTAPDVYFSSNIPRDLFYSTPFP